MDKFKTKIFLWYSELSNNGEVMILEMRQLLEQDGCEVIEGGWDFKFKTRIFIRHPDGRLNPYYDNLSQIPILPNGTNIDLAKNAMPTDEIYGSTAVKDAGAITNTETGLDASGLPIPIIIGYIVIAVILLAIVICIYFMIHPPIQQPPCGTEAKIVDVGDCAKIIIMPNCDSRLFDSCTDEWLEEDWHTWEPPANWATWLVIGIIAIGAIVIIPPLLRTIKPRYPPQPSPRPPIYHPPSYRFPTKP